jgi:serine/threonine protein kinase
MWSLGEAVFRMLTGELTFKTMGLLANYVQIPDHFPSNALLARGVRSGGCDFIKRVMMPTPGERLTAKDALLHDWIEPDTSLGLEPSSTVFKRYEEFSVQLISCSDWA